MCGGVIGNLVPGSANRFDLVREFARPFPNDKEGRLRPETLENLEDAGRV
jgi:hypothetical protein